MLMPHPAVLRGLLEEYEAAAANEPADATGAPGPRTRDLAYTLCVSTGTRDVARALEAARLQLTAAATHTAKAVEAARTPMPAKAGAKAGTMTSAKAPAPMPAAAAD
ncbi:MULTISPECIES: DUF5133 domain-containing protein [Streptomyces]|uniref:DUF5133 domain-containing protein n=1 Tax=Streptomyces olivaceus TaxID=47716 RepID=A0ABS7W963_STROV|nr:MULTISPECIES: DUF5133 domain-containing protein [Streptomyces]MBZ6091380.1 DUF5133 domain-containing protein [Streptomyces olivaceus]MBZ6098186.1 DUF5133 domain-containing protein [Streptomyces olivaceus]MBZ6110029.1 DUF5133 domain-containing protein [Streptomyces olivaceus]MBZ6118723.1 DUF5133 domain-containing protein [Streptomyces olivaceus]MBZ6124164.1 DUF5133 domain-containing protein [Streptomyces olivaceus]